MTSVTPVQFGDYPYGNNPERYSNLVFLEERPHWSVGVSPERLGKDPLAPELRFGNPLLPDPEGYTQSHFSLNYLCAFDLFGGNPLSREAVQTTIENYLLNRSIDENKFSNFGSDQARSLRMEHTVVQCWEITGDPRIPQRLSDRMVRTLPRSYGFPFWTDHENSGGEWQRIAGVVANSRPSPEWWSPWECFLTHGCASAYKLTRRLNGYNWQNWLDFAYFSYEVVEQSLAADVVPPIDRGDVDVDEDRLSNYLVNSIKNDIMDRDMMGWKDKREYDIKAYHGIKDAYLSSWPWSNSSNYPVPITPVLLDTGQSAIMGSAFREIMNTVVVTGIGEEDIKNAGKVQDIMNWTIGTGIEDFYSEMDGNVHQMLKHGTSYLKIVTDIENEFKLCPYTIPYTPVPGNRDRRAIRCRTRAVSAQWLCVVRAIWRLRVHRLQCLHGQSACLRRR